MEMMSKQTKFLLGIFFISLFFGTFIGFGRANYTQSIKIDGKFDRGYSLFKERATYTIYSANSQTEFYLYVNFTFNLENETIIFNSEHLTLNLSNNEIQTNYLHSKHINTTLEFKISRKLIENKLFTIEIPGKIITESFVLPIYSPEDLGLSEWGWISIIILILIVVAVYDMIRKAGKKIIVKGYKTVDVIRENDSYETHKFSGLKIIGEFKSETFRADRRCYEFKFKHRNKHFNVLSNYTMGTYQNNHLIEKIIIYYSLNVHFFTKKLDKRDYYVTELGWTKQALIYKFLSFCFYLNSSGIILSMLICGSLFAVSFPEMSFAFLIGCAVGILISTINFLLRRSTHLLDPLLKRKKELIDHEIYMSPLEADEEILNEYRVKGTRQNEVKKSDGALQIESIKLQDKPQVDYLTVVGYDALYRLETDSQVKITSKEIIGQQSRKRTNQEMLNLRRSYLARNKVFVEDNFRLKEENETLQQLMRELHGQIQHLDETRILELQDFGLKMSKQKEWQKTTIKKVFEKIYGQAFISERWEDSLREIYRMIDGERQETKANTMSILIQSVKKLITLIGQKADLNVDQITTLLKKIQIEGDEVEGAKKAT